MQAVRSICAEFAFERFVGAESATPCLAPALLPKAAAAAAVAAAAAAAYVPSAAWNDDIEFNFDLVDYDLEEFADLGSGQSSTVRNLKHRTNKGSVQSIETDAELSAALEPLHMAKIPPGTVPVDGSIVVVRTWNSGVLPPTMSSVGGATAHGFAITSPGMVRSLRALVELQALRMLPCLVAHLDCTWKNLNNGWATGVWGVSVLVKGGGIVETSSMDEQQRFLADAKISHSFVPLLLCSTKTENHFDMEQFMTAHTDMVHKFCGPTAVLNLDAVMMDHSHSLAGPVVSKGICDEILSCYFHVIKNVNENKAKLKYKASLPLVLEDVRRLHMSRSEEQFAAMAIVFLKRWTDAGEEAFADYFRGAHLSGVFAKWHIAAGPQRLPCTNNALESFNNYGIKMVMARDRATLGAWLSNDGVLQKVLGEIDATRTLDAKQLMPFLSQRDLRSFNPPGRQTLQKALGILHASGSHTALERPVMHRWVTSDKRTIDTKQFGAPSVCDGEFAIVVGVELEHETIIVHYRNNSQESIPFSEYK
ncbi:hypothetical protein B484DRAFT_403560 [Ochromonadaceae sp. CCMP2298]|nr:hypothetical protein B484DRAFT_403560 [Ochromonadaceae sp. CCMP2298]